VKFAILLALLLWQAGPETSTPQYLRYQRIVAPSDPGQNCAVIDPQLFPHAAPSLKDLRLFGDNHEVPYAITLSEPQQPDSDTATIRNLGLRGRKIVFDLEMPNRPYTEIDLALAGHDFLATATVSGTRNPNYSNQTHLGDYTLFDLTTQHLSRNTSIHLQETSLPYLHVELAISPAAGASASSLTPEALQKLVQGVTIPPSREAQSIYTTAARSVVTQRGRQSIASFALPERIPIERVSFDLAPTYKANFSRDVHITDHPDGTANSANSASETLVGTILRVHLTQAGREIRQEQLSIPAILGSNMQSEATVQVAVENGDDTPLPITGVRLEMRQRKICFDAPNERPLTLYYGDPALTAPQYDYARLFSLSSAVHTAQLGRERLNVLYHDRPDARPLTERRPHLLWIILLVVICILAIIAIRSSKHIHH
jgi:hypothetical protein